MSARPITEDDLNGFVDDRLEPERRGEVAAYLHAHPDVARRIALYREHSSLLEEVLGPIAEEPIPPELDVSYMVANKRKSLLPKRWAMVAAAVALVSCGAAAGWIARSIDLPATRGIDALAREARASYAVYAPDQIRPVEIRAEDRDSLAAWTEKRIGRSIPFPDMVASGYRFMGGRIVPTPHGPAALFMYDDDNGNRLAMLIRPMAIEADAAMSLHAQGSVNGYAWADKGLGYSLIGTLPAERLQPMADEARRQLRQTG